MNKWALGIPLENAFAIASLQVLRICGHLRNSKVHPSQQVPSKHWLRFTMSKYHYKSYFIASKTRALDTQVQSTDLNPTILFCGYVGCSGERILACPSSVFEGWLLHIGSMWRFPTRHAIPPRLQNIQTATHNVFTRFAKSTRLVEVLTAQSELKATGPPLGLSGVVVSSLSILASATNKTINYWCTGYTYHSSQWGTIWSLKWRFQMTLWVGPTNPPEMWSAISHLVSIESYGLDPPYNT